MTTALEPVSRLSFRRGGLRDALGAVVAGGTSALVVRDGADVSPLADSFARHVLDARDRLGPSVLGASLSLPRFLQNGRIPLVPLPDGLDAFYARPVPVAAALFWPDAAQTLLAGWTGQDDEGLVGALASADGYLLVPRAPLASDTGARPTETSLLAQRIDSWRIAPPGETLAVYDDRWELAEASARALIAQTIPGSLTIDLWGTTGAAARSAYLLSTRPCAHPIQQFALELVPPEANLRIPCENGLISLGNWTDFGPMAPDASKRLAHHATRYNAIGDYFGQVLMPLKKAMAFFRR